MRNALELLEEEQESRDEDQDRNAASPKLWGEGLYK